MPDYLAQVTLFPQSNVLADASVNTFSFTAVSDADLPDIRTALVAEYNGVVARFSAAVRQNNHLIKIYDRSDATPRAPKFLANWNFASAPTGNPLPTEVALVLSFQGDQVSGIPQARRRGRVYFGPLNVGNSDTNGRPNATTLADFANFGTSLLAASDAAANWSWVVWSDVMGGPAFITNGWLDDEFDTQRRRGRSSTARTLWS